MFNRVSLWFLVVLCVVAILVPLLPVDPNAFDPNQVGDPQPPSFQHPLGTDDLGRDLLIRSLFGARVSLLVGIVSMVIALGIGLGLGLVSGYKGGWVDDVIMRIVDVFMAIPTIFLLLTIQVLLTPSLWNVVVVIGLTSWMGMARLVRAEVLSLKTQTFVLALRARGYSPARTLFKHVLPHTLNPIIVAVMLGMGGAILSESVLSFLGLGVQPPHASWGNMLENALAYVWDAPWMILVPGVWITATVLALNFVGDSIRDFFDPKELAKHVRR